MKDMTIENVYDIYINGEKARHLIGEGVELDWHPVWETGDVFYWGLFPIGYHFRVKPDDILVINDKELKVRSVGNVVYRFPKGSKRELVARVVVDCRASGRDDRFPPDGSDREEYLEELKRRCHIARIVREKNNGRY